MELRLKATEEKYGEVRLPRAVRLCRKCNFSNNEMMIILYVLTFQNTEEERERYFLYGDSHGVKVLYMCTVLDIPLLEIFDFLNPDRLHMQQGLFPNVQQNDILSSSLELDYDVYLALIGVDLKQKDFLKIDQTCLADVIFEEPEYKHFRQQVEEDKLKQLTAAAATCKKEECNNSYILC